MIPEAEGVPWEVWAARVYEDYCASGIPIPGSVTGWRFWADQFRLANTDLSASDLPMASAFARWQDWAQRLRDLQLGRQSQHAVKGLHQ